LIQLFNDARANKQYAVAHGCLTEIAKELFGMFQEKPARKFIDWDGDVTTLSDQELEQLQYLMEKLAYGDDQAKILSVRRQVADEVGVQVIDVSLFEFKADPREEEKETEGEGW
jgi:hypothetical protein